jgi:diphosphoinositol-polyphosphate diphosphatase
MLGTNDVHPLTSAKYTSSSNTLKALTGRANQVLVDIDVVGIDGATQSVQGRGTAGCASFRLVRRTRRHASADEPTKNTLDDAANNADNSHVDVESAADPLSSNNTFDTNNVVADNNDVDDDDDDSQWIVQFLLVRNRHRNDWIFPKGGQERDETPAEAALRETMEEAGVAGDIVAALDVQPFVSPKGKHSLLAPFLLHVTRVLDVYAEDSRARQWLTLTQCEAAMKREGMRNILHAASAVVAAAPAETRRRWRWRDGDGGDTGSAPTPEHGD